MKYLINFALLLVSCGQSPLQETLRVDRQTRQVSFNGINVTVVIDQPALQEMDVLIVYHGTVQFDSNLIPAATNTLDNFKSILQRKDMMLVSVAYPQENVLFGDGIQQAEAALLWVQQKANSELGIRVKKIFLAGHSQGGYMVARLNTMHATNGVISNAPGPLNLVYRCQLEESGQIASGAVCTKLSKEYGTTTANPEAYYQRSLLNYTQGYKSDILFFQGLNDSPIQLYSWPTFKQEISRCTNCRGLQFYEIPGGEHGALFTNSQAKLEFNTFIDKR
jgi:hypothetical protein